MYVGFQFSQVVCDSLIQPPVIIKLIVYTERCHGSAERCQGDRDHCEIYLSYSQFGICLGYCSGDGEHKGQSDQSPLNYLVSRIEGVTALHGIVFMVLYFIEEPSDGVGMIFNISLDKFVARILTLFLAIFRFVTDLQRSVQGGSVWHLVWLSMKTLWPARASRGVRGSIVRASISAPLDACVRHPPSAEEVLPGHRGAISRRRDNGEPRTGMQEQPQGAASGAQEQMEGPPGDRSPRSHASFARPITGRSGALRSGWATHRIRPIQVLVFYFWSSTRSGSSAKAPKLPSARFSGRPTKP